MVSDGGEILPHSDCRVRRYGDDMSGLDVYLEEFAHRISNVLGDSLVAIYLHGSAAMDAFVPSRSDVDVVCVTGGPLSPSQKRELAEALSEESLPCPGVGLEMSVVTVAEARSPSDLPRFELHIATEENRIVDGSGRGGNLDLVVEFAMTRGRGVALLGPPPSDLIAPVDRAAVLGAMAEDLRWAIENDRAGYAVLNACRCLRFLREGTLGSKLEAGENGPSRPALVMPTSSVRPWIGNLEPIATWIVARPPRSPRRFARNSSGSSRVDADSDLHTLYVAS